MRESLVALLSTPAPIPVTARRKALACAIIFVAALGIRLLHWQDSQIDLTRRGTMLKCLIKPYWQESKRTLDEHTILMPRNHSDPGDARMIVHPPGYSVLLAIIFRVIGAPGSLLRVMQLFQAGSDAVAAVLVFLIASALFPAGMAFIAGLLVAVSPHFAYYSLWLSPDTLSALPVLVAIYLLILAQREPRVRKLVAAGALVGLSCWLRSNGVLLAPFLAAVSLLIFEKGKRIGYATALVAATVVVISPITIRNWVVYGHFVPLSLATGLNLIQGIAEFDKEGRFGMPLSDNDARLKDVEWHSRPDYAKGLWRPDGIERDQDRFNRGMAVISANPGWFLSAMVRRAAFMFAYNDPGNTDWPFYTSNVPPVSPEPTFFHSNTRTDGLEPAWSATPSTLFASGQKLSGKADVTLATDGQTLVVRGDDSVYGDQFVTASIGVEPHKDYMLTLMLRLEQGYAGVKVTDKSQRSLIASALPEQQGERLMTSDEEVPEFRLLDPVDGEPKSLVRIPFASGERTEVRIVLSNNNGRESPRPVAYLGEARLYLLGATPLQATRTPRVIVGFIQKQVYTSRVLRPLIVAGLILMILARRKNALLILLAVPIYYMASHAGFSTEYRYVLGIHYFLFICAAATLYVGGAVVLRTARDLGERLRALG